MYPSDPLNDLVNRTDDMVDEMDKLISLLKEISVDLQALNIEFEKGMEL